MKFQNHVRLVLISTCICFAGLAAFRLVLPQSQSDTSLQAHVNQVASRLHAPGDEDTLTVATSSLASAEHIRYQIQQDILKGMSDGEILRAMRSQYGTEILAVPPMQGVGSVIWDGVWICLLGSGALAWYGWRRISRKRHDAGLNLHGIEHQAGERIIDVEPSGQIMKRLREYL